MKIDVYLVTTRHISDFCLAECADLSLKRVKRSRRTKIPIESLDSSEAATVGNGLLDKGV